MASPALTGTPTVPTAAVNTNTTQAASTAFVVAQVADDAPTKTGTGASGTWGISITGNAATATSASSATYATSAGSAPASDVYAWAKQATKPSYTYSEVGAPSTTGTNASGTWGINVTGSSGSTTGNAATATLATKASTLARDGGNGIGMTFNWAGQSGQPAWLWGSNDGSNIYVWNPSNFSVNYASSAGYATSAGSATSADQIDGVPFTNTGSNLGTNADTIESNGISYYVSGVPDFTGNSADGALYSQAYSASWQHQIAGDYRSGQIALRGKNSGTWQAWRTVLDSSNYNNYAPTKTGGGASGTWGINITGNAATASNGGVTSVNGATGAVTLSTGGVTSLNGQTGAITNTTLDAIGSYIWGRPAGGANYAHNTTIAGSSLYSMGNVSNNSAHWSGYYGAFRETTSLRTLPGTWRTTTGAGGNNYNGGNGLWVRIS